MQVEGLILCQLQETCAPPGRKTRSVETLRPWDSLVVPDGYEDDQIHCLKDGQLCHAGSDRRTSIQQAVPASRATNPFAEVRMSDIEGAAQENSLTDLSDNEIEIEIE